MRISQKIVKGPLEIVFEVEYIFEGECTLSMETHPDFFCELQGRFNLDRVAWSLGFVDDPPVFRDDMAGTTEAYPPSVRQLSIIVKGRRMRSSGSASVRNLIKYIGDYLAKWESLR